MPSDARSRSPYYYYCYYWTERQEREGGGWKSISTVPWPLFVSRLLCGSDNAIASLVNSHGSRRHDGILVVVVAIVISTRSLNHPKRIRTTRFYNKGAPKRAESDGGEKGNGAGSFPLSGEKGNEVHYAGEKWRPGIISVP